MKRFAQLFLLLASILASYATPPPTPEPIHDAFARFQDSCPTQCDSLIKELRRRAAPAKDGKAKELFDGLERYLSNIRQDDISRLRRELTSKVEPRKLRESWRRLVVDIVGFRRVLDEFLVEAVVSKSLSIDEGLLARLREFWKQEYYFSWRFGHEAEEPDQN